MSDEHSARAREPNGRMEYRRVADEKPGMSLSGCVATSSLAHPRAGVAQRTADAGGVEPPEEEARAGIATQLFAGVFWGAVGRPQSVAIALMSSVTREYPFCQPGQRSGLLSD